MPHLCANGTIRTSAPGLATGRLAREGRSGANHSWHGARIPGRAMKTAYALAALLLAACGGATDKDLKGSGGSGAAAGNSGSSGFSGGGAGGSTSGGAGGGAAVSGSGGVATGGGAGTGGYGASPGCCSTAADCPSYTYGPPPQCIAGVCKEAPPGGQCWSDKDCNAGVQGACIGAFVCPCDADCDGPDQPGKCVTVGPGCCTKNSDCPASSAGQMICVEGNCEQPLSPGQCWSNKDCSPTSTCTGACVCPCGAICACGGSVGKCSPSPGPLCCSSDKECLGAEVCAAGVCKAPASGACWKDAECGPSATCEGESICPCGALCALADYPGKCVKHP